MSELLSIPVKAGNDANVAALGEMWKGGGEGYLDVVLLTLGTGVGGGIIINGEIAPSHRGVGGELGHITVNPDEEATCNCGNHGCLEQYASATGVVRIANKLLAASKEESSLRTLETVTAKDVFDASKAGDHLAVEAVEVLGKYLGLVVANVALTVDPDVFVIGGGVSKAGQVLIDVITKYYHKFAKIIGDNKAKVVLAKLGNEWKKFARYYKPYLGSFAADMFFAILGAAVTLIIPMVVRYITGTVIYEEPDKAMKDIAVLAVVMIALVAVEFVCNYFIATVGHNMGAKMETDMRTEIFDHYQKLSFSFFDNQKVGQLMSRVTNDLFDISELFHHGPEDVVISLIKFIGTMVILLNIHTGLALCAAASLPFMLVFAYVYNGKLKRAFKRNRDRIADINAQLEDSLSGVRVVKSFGNEDAEMGKFQSGNNAFLESKKS